MGWRSISAPGLIQSPVPQKRKTKAKTEQNTGGRMRKKEVYSKVAPKR